LVDITYDVAADFPTVSVSLQVSSNGGSTFVVPATTLSGAIGAGVATGTAKTITWDAGVDWSGQYTTQMRFKVIADDGNSAPTISDIADQTINQGNNTGALAFTLGDAQTAAGSLSVSGISSNTTLVPNANIVFGGSGANRTVTVTPDSSQLGTAMITVTASDGSLSESDTFLLTVEPTGFALVPQGSFTMGNSVAADTDITDAPTRTVTLDAYYIGKYEVTKAEWDEVRTWGLSKGYTDLAVGSLYQYQGSNHPVNTIDWYNIVKWCNARSQKEGLTPVYYTNNAQTTIYKTGSVNVTNAQVKWAANGYRLPTEAEWEKAARGGLSGKRFPWGDTISHSQANYYASSSYANDLSGSVNNYHPTYATGSMPYTSPVGAFAANGYGLYDMAGNVWEWCWDWYGTYAAGSQTNPRGATSGTDRVLRGGGWMMSGPRVAYRYGNIGGPSSTFNSPGFRVLRSSVP
jgi:formylglycine-generating enzyme required for sulfatase activity